MILIALGQLGTVDISFKKANGLAAVLIFLSVALQLMVKTSIDINQLTTAPLGMHAYIQGTAILHALLAD